MILSTHALTGAVIGKEIGNPWLIIFISLIVHFIMDSFSHGEYLNPETFSLKKEVWKVVLDLFLGFSVIILYVYFSKADTMTARNIFIGAFASIFPDSLTFLYYKFNFRFLKKIVDFHKYVHRYPRFSEQRKWSLKNASNDIIIIALAIFLLII
jgi:hypothetical protein